MRLQMSNPVVEVEVRPKLVQLDLVVVDLDHVVGVAVVQTAEILAGRLVAIDDPVTGIQTVAGQQDGAHADGGIGEIERILVDALGLCRDIELSIGGQRGVVDVGPRRVGHLVEGESDTDRVGLLTLFIVGLGDLHTDGDPARVGLDG